MILSWQFESEKIEHRYKQVAIIYLVFVAFDKAFDILELELLTTHQQSVTVKGQLVHRCMYSLFKEAAKS